MHYSRLVVLNQGWFWPPTTPTRGHLCYLKDIFDMTVGGGGSVVLLASNGWRPGMLLNTLLLLGMAQQRVIGPQCHQWWGEEGLTKWKKQTARLKLSSSIMRHSGRTSADEERDTSVAARSKGLRKGEWLLSSTRNWRRWEMLSVFVVRWWLHASMCLSTHTRLHKRVNLMSVNYTWSKQTKPSSVWTKATLERQRGEGSHQKMRNPESKGKEKNEGNQRNILFVLVIKLLTAPQLTHIKGTLVIDQKLYKTSLLCWYNCHAVSFPSL